MCKGAPSPQDFAVPCTCLKTIRSLGIGESFSTVPSTPMLCPSRWEGSPLLHTLLGVKIQTIPTKYYWAVVLLEDLVHLVTAVPMVLERGPFPALSWFMAPLLWPLVWLPVNCSSCEGVQSAYLPEALAVHGLLTTLEFFAWFFGSVLLGEPAHLFHEINAYSLMDSLLK